MGSVDGWSDALDELDDLHDDCEGAPECGYYWALIVPNHEGRYALNGIAEGCNWAYGCGNDVAFGEWTVETLAHELGHNMGMGHAAGCDDPAGVDDSIPYEIEDYGFNAETRQVYDPATTRDLMSYAYQCDQMRWPSIHTYNAIYSWLVDHNAQVQAQATATRQPGLLVAGRVDPSTDTGEIRRADLYRWPGGPFDQVGVGPYSLELQNASAAVLFTHLFTPTLRWADGENVSGEFFKEVLPPQAGARRDHAGDPTDQPNAPAVTLLAPNGGENITAPFQARWQAQDADGDPLTYALQISRDSGQSWLPVTRGLTETTYTLDPARLPGGDHLCLRVLAHDGVRTTGDDQPVRALRRHGGQSDPQGAFGSWQTVEADLTEYAGQTIGIFFAVRNDGHAGQTWVEVDNVALCVSAAALFGSPLGACGLPQNLADYAPVGLPDFDMRQADWQTTIVSRTAWTHDGPAALADLLWWRDSATETGITPPPAVSDSHALVAPYGPWDDHDPQNVPPLVEDLAARANTNTGRPGTDLDDLTAGLNGYLAAKGLADAYDVTVHRSPSFDWVRDAVKQHEGVLLLLGFWELQPGGWKRLGGHYVAAAGVGCTTDQIALSDPFRDAAEFGWPGHVAPPGWHGHSPTPPFTLHNDAAYVSHDIYGIMRTTNGWGPQGYARTLGEIADFAGLNFAPALEAPRAAGYNGGQILTLADYALVLAPRRAEATLRLAPGFSLARGGEIFTVEVAVHAGVKGVNRGQAFLNFDTAILRVVDENGVPATQITPGAALTNVLVNGADNATGRIGFVAQGDVQTGRFTLATVHFQAISPTLTTRLEFSFVAPRRSDLLLNGQSVLAGLRGGQTTVLPGAHITGQVTLEGRPAPPNAVWSVPLLLTLGQPGERGPAYAFGMMSTQNGAFAIPGVVAPGDTRVRLKGLHTLRNLLPTTLVSGENTVNMATLLKGDAYGDNRVNGRDVSLLAAAFGKSQGQPGFDPRADFNENDAVNAPDLTLLQANLGRRGDLLLGASVAAAAGDEPALLLDFEPRDTGLIGLRIAPSSALAAVSRTIVLDVIADAGTQPVDTVELYLDFDPALLQAVDAAGAPATTIQPGTVLPAVRLNRVDRAWGQIDFVASSAGGAAPSGQITIARLRFKALAAG